jgi:hypothetical protein
MFQFLKLMKEGCVGQSDPGAFAWIAVPSVREHVLRTAGTFSIRYLSGNDITRQMRFPSTKMRAAAHLLAAPVVFAFIYHRLLFAAFKVHKRRTSSDKLIVTGPTCDAVLVLNPEVFGCMSSASPVECCGVWSVVPMFASLPVPGDHAAQLHSGLHTELQLEQTRTAIE